MKVFRDLGLRSWEDWGIVAVFALIIWGIAHPALQFYPLAVAWIVISTLLAVGYGVRASSLQDALSDSAEPERPVPTFGRREVVELGADALKLMEYARSADRGLSVADCEAALLKASVATQFFDEEPDPIDQALSDLLERLETRRKGSGSS